MINKCVAIFTMRSLYSTATLARSQSFLEKEDHARNEPSSVTKSCYSQMHRTGFEPSKERFLNDSASFVLIPHRSFLKKKVAL